MTVRALLTPACIVLVAACGRPPVVRHSLIVSAMVDGEVPIMGVRVSALGDTLGATDSAGRLATEIQGREGQQIELIAECPVGFQGPRSPTPLRLSTVRSLAQKSDTLTVSVACRPLTRQVAIVVSSPGLADVPVLVDGEPRARIDRDGVAYLLLSARPGDVLSVALDTSTREDLVPSRPTHLLRIEDADQILVVNDAPTVRPLPRAARRRPQERLYRIQ